MRSLQPWVGAIHELPLPKVSYLNPETPNIVADSTGINIRRNQDTQDAASLQLMTVGKRHRRVLADHSGAAGIDIRSNPVASE